MIASGMRSRLWLNQADLGDCEHLYNKEKDFYFVYLTNNKKLFKTSYVRYSSIDSIACYHKLEVVPSSIKSMGWKILQSAEIPFER